MMIMRMVAVMMIMILVGKTLIFPFLTALLQTSGFYIAGDDASISNGGKTINVSGFPVAYKLSK